MGWMAFPLAIVAVIGSMLSLESRLEEAALRVPDDTTLSALVALQASAERLCGDGCAVGAIEGLSGSASMAAVYDGHRVISWTTAPAALSGAASAPLPVRAQLGRYHAATGIAVGAASIAIAGTASVVPPYTISIDPALGIPDGAVVLVSAG